MIIQIVGTNASGKTTAMRKVIAQGREPIEITGEKGKTLAHELVLADRVVRVLGPYSEGGATSKGMDYLGGTAEWQYRFIKEQHDEAGTVLYEGMRLHNMKRTAELYNAGITIHIVMLTTPMEDILKGLAERRAAKGKEQLADLTNIELNYKRARSFAANMYSLGATVHKVGRDEAPDRILNILQNF